MRHVCVHGHFYQPPRENPWLDVVPAEPSAAPWHDWNRRIARECYAPNAAARIVGEDGRIERIVGNYERMSFDFGPTLLAWLEAEEPEIYAAVLQADAASAERFSGHGSAMAQPFHHVIQPLAGRRDKSTQVRWGVADFEARFGRRPEGMWLPETAVDLETLELLAAAGIAYVVLAPHQAAAVRRVGERRWRELDAAPDRPGALDTTVPYRLVLPSGASLAAFFYDGPLSRAVAFERLLEDGAALQRRLLESASRDGGLGHVAVDGETFGHHRRFGEMALASALGRIEAEPGAALTNYGEHLERTPPAWEARVAEDTSWSCPHGVERWRADCGCATGERAAWTQEWRGPLRQALEWLRVRLDEVFEEVGGAPLRSPWEARDDYVDVVLDRSDRRAEAFAARHLDPDAAVEPSSAWRLLEMQGHAMAMFASCGWFFDDLAGLGSVQVLRSAGRAIELAAPFAGAALEDGFVERLEAAVSNDREAGDGVRIYRRAVEAARLDLVEVGANLAALRLVERRQGRASSDSQPHPVSERDLRSPAGPAVAASRELRRYRLVDEDLRSDRPGDGVLELAGEATVASELTRESLRLCLSATLSGSGRLRVSAEAVAEGHPGDPGRDGRVEDIVEVALEDLLPGVASAVAELAARRALAEVEPAVRAAMAGGGIFAGSPGGAAPGAEGQSAARGRSLDVVAAWSLEEGLAAALAAPVSEADAAVSSLRDASDTSAQALALRTRWLGLDVEKAALRWLAAAPGTDALAAGARAALRLLEEARRSGIEIDPWRLQNRVWSLATDAALPGGSGSEASRGRSRPTRPEVATALGELADLLGLHLPEGWQQEAQGTGSWVAGRDSVRS